MPNWIDLVRKTAVVRRAARRLSSAPFRAPGPQKTLSQAKPNMSVVVVVHNMAREAPRTLHSLSAAYQRDIHADDYEVIVVDNGSKPAFDSTVIKNLTGNFRLIRMEHPVPPSPGPALNRGIAAAQGDVIGVMIDGARLVTPGLLHFAGHGAGLYERSVVVTLGWFLGYDFQRHASVSGYDQAREDALLVSINWPHDGYRLFEIATMDGSSDDGWFAPIAESNALFLRRDTWELLGGVDEQFDTPGGGLLNFDTLRRAIELPDSELVILLGEASFHQIHGGIATNSSIESFLPKLTQWSDEYTVIRKQPYELPRPRKRPTYLGVLPQQMLSRFTFAAAAQSHPRLSEPPLGRNFDRGLWSLTPPVPPTDPAVARLVEIAQREFRTGRYDSAGAVARLARQRAPEEHEPQRLLSLVAGRSQDATVNADYHMAQADAHRVLGDKDVAISHYQRALYFNNNLVQAHIGLATLRFPGEYYLAWLERLYSVLAPETLIDIGVFHGDSLSLAMPPTLAIGVDPQPKLTCALKTETHIFVETSDAFFERRGLDSLLAGRPLSIGFIDGLHLYEQALRDFINLERYCGRQSVILLHDTVPLDEATQSRETNTKFHTGDVWRVVLCLKHYRPDLDVFTIAAPWTGLTVVTGLNSASRILADCYEEAVARFIAVPFHEIENTMADALNLVPNEWPVVEGRLRARGVLKNAMK
jgi:glycosyltransferase involved in cell wall biosynthesis